MMPVQGAASDCGGGFDSRHDDLEILSTSRLVLRFVCGDANLSFVGYGSLTVK